MGRSERTAARGARWARASAVAAATVVGAGLASAGWAGVARADVTDDVVLATVVFDQAYGGRTQLRGGGETDREAQRATLGASLRLEVLFAKYVAIGAAGGIAWWKPGGGSVLDAGDRHPVVDATGFARLRFALDDRSGEYYLLVGGGPSWLLFDEGEPNAFGQGVAGERARGYHLTARVGVRAEVEEGIGAMLELGWTRRQHDDAFVVADGGGGTTSLDWITNQVAVVIGWYVAL